MVDAAEALINYIMNFKEVTAETLLNFESSICMTIALSMN